MYGAAVQWMPGITLEQMEKSVIEAAFRFYRGNKTQIASALGIAIRTLDSKMEKYDADKRADDDALEARKRADKETLARFRGPELTKQFSTGSSSQWASEGDGSARANERGQENNSETNPSNAEGGNKAGTGVLVQPTSEVGPQSGMPMSERKEVQSVLPRSASSNRSGRHR